MHPYPSIIQPSFLVLSCDHVIQIIFPFYGFHEGITNIKVHSNLQQPTTWQQLNMCLTFLEPPSPMFYFLFLKVQITTKKTSPPPPSPLRFFSSPPSHPLQCMYMLSPPTCHHPTSFLLLNSNRLTYVFPFTLS
jgi:hypothetical protein